MTTETKIVFVRVANHGAADAGVRAPKHDFVIFERVRGIAIFFSFYATEITVVTNFGIRSTVSLVIRVVMRSSSLASLGEVTYK